MGEDSETRTDQPSWFGAYAPAEHVKDATGGIAYGSEKKVEHGSAALLESGEVIMDFDMVTGDTVRLVFDWEGAEKVRDLLTEYLEEDIDERRP